MAESRVNGAQMNKLSQDKLLQPSIIRNMKRSLPLAIILSAMFTFHAAAQNKDRLGASDAELERLKQLNTTGQVVSRSDAELHKLMVGKWTTGRHEYAY